MELEEVGNIDEAELDFEPVTIPIVGYTDAKEKVVTKIRFRRNAPAGFALDMIRAVDAKGNLTVLTALKYLDGCVYEADREAWEDLIHGKGVNISDSTISDVYTRLGEFYTGRPTSRRSGSSRGQSSTKQTTQRAAKSQASTKKTSR
jgi:hypothetical protein